MDLSELNFFLSWALAAIGVVLVIKGLSSWRSGGQADVCLGAAFWLVPTTNLIPASRPWLRGTLFVVGAVVIATWWVRIYRPAHPPGASRSLGTPR